MVSIFVCPSPCCGGKGNIEGDGDRVWITCERCGMRGPVELLVDYDTEEETCEMAVMDWNRLKR